MSSAEPLNQVDKSFVTGDPTYYFVYTGPVTRLNDWLKSTKGKEIVLPILETRPVRIWCPNDNNAIIRLEKRNV